MTIRGVRRVLITFAVGLAMGVVYWALHTQSPAPALIGLAGLGGIVVGEMVMVFLQARYRLRKQAKSFSK